MDASALMSRDAGLFAAERVVLWMAATAYGVALLFYIAHIIRPSWKISRTGSTVSLLSAATLQTIVIILRVVRAAPLSTRCSPRTPRSSRSSPPFRARGSSGTSPSRSAPTRSS